MAIFTNQATMTYNGVTATSNTAYGEILDVLSVTKTAVDTGYQANGLVTYVVTLRNTGTTALSGLTLSDDLGGYTFGTATVTPLTYEDGSILAFADGVPQATPTVTAGPPMIITGFTVPAEGDAVLVYQARANAYADPSQTGSIVNTVTVTGSGLSAPITATETVDAVTAAQITIFKSISPSQVVENDTVTYTFRIENLGNEAVEATDGAIISDTFDPVLTGLTVTLDGTVLTPVTDYTYDETSGQFATVAGVVTVPAATVTQDPTTGAFSITPGVTVLTVSGTI